MLIAYATAVAGWDEHAELFGNPALDDDDAATLRAHLVSCGAKGFAEGLARYYANRAVARLLEPHIPAALRHELHPVADDVLARVK